MNKRKKRKPWPKSGLLPLIANQNPVRRWLGHLTVNKNRKGKGQEHSKPKFPPKNTIPQEKSYWSMITHVIFDLIGNDLQSQVMAYLWFGIRMKHLPVWDWYTLSDFLLFFVGPSISSIWSFRNEMLIIQNLIYGYGGFHQQTLLPR